MYLYGKNSVLARLNANPKSIKRIFIQQNFSKREILDIVNGLNIPLERVSEKQILRIKRAERLQGVVAEVDKFSYTDFEELLYTSHNKKLSFIFLDSINDPHNLGSIIRIAACFGDFAIIVSKHNSCEVTDAVMHVASGGENFVPVSIVNNMATAIIKAKKSGYWVVGAVVENGVSIDNLRLPFPLCLTMGSEGRGIRYGIDKHLDLKVSLSMPGVSLSFNVAMACAIFCHEIAKQRVREISPSG